MEMLSFLWVSGTCNCVHAPGVTEFVTRFAKTTPGVRAGYAYTHRMTDERKGEPHPKRRGPRVVGPFQGRWRGALAVPLVIHDLSAGGCLILGSNISLPDQIMTLEIDLPGGDMITVQAQPLYVRSNVGFAVKFVNVPSATGMWLQRLVTGLAAAEKKTARRK